MNKKNKDKELAQQKKIVVIKEEINSGQEIKQIVNHEWNEDGLFELTERTLADSIFLSFCIIISVTRPDAMEKLSLSAADCVV